MQSIEQDPFGPCSDCPLASKCYQMIDMVLRERPGEEAPVFEEPIPPDESDEYVPTIEDLNELLSVRESPLPPLTPEEREEHERSMHFTIRKDLNYDDINSMREVMAQLLTLLGSGNCPHKGEEPSETLTFCLSDKTEEFLDIFSEAYNRYIFK